LDCIIRSIATLSRLCNLNQICQKGTFDELQIINEAKEERPSLLFIVA